MPLTISDKLLQMAGFTESDARAEIACRLYDAERLTLHQAACWAGLDRLGIEAALLSRKIPVYRFTHEDIAIELSALRGVENAR